MLGTSHPMEGMQANRRIERGTLIRLDGYRPETRSDRLERAERGRESKMGRDTSPLVARRGGINGGGELAPDGRRREAAAKPSAPAYRIIDTKTIRPNVSGDYSSAKKKFECTQNLEFLIEFFGPPSSSQSGVPPRRLIISSRPLRSPKCSLLPSPREHMGGRAHEVNSVCRWRPFRKWSQRSLGANCRVW